MPLGGIPAIHTRIALGAVGVGFLVLSTAAAAGALAMGGVPVSGVHSPFIAVVCVAIGLKNLVSVYVVKEEIFPRLPYGRDI